MLAARTMRGPVGMRGPNCEASVPATPETAPNSPASGTMTDSRSVQYRAATGRGGQQGGHEHHAHRLQPDHHRHDDAPG